MKISFKTNVRRWQNFVFNTACNGTDGYHYETNTESEIDNGVKLSHVSYPKRGLLSVFKCIPAVCKSKRVSSFFTVLPVVSTSRFIGHPTQ